MHDPRCTCDGSLCGPELLRFRCVMCWRSVPWCFGASDELRGSCDACWAACMAVFHPSENR